MNTPNIEIRLATDVDFEPNYEIWLDGIAKTFANFSQPENLKTLFQNNFQNRVGSFNYWVAAQDNIIVGWCSISPLTSNPLKMDKWAEVSTYINRHHKNNGVGTRLMQYVFSELKHTPIQFVFGFADVLNTKSIKMCYNAGMTSTGTVPQPFTPPILAKN